MPRAHLTSPLAFACLIGVLGCGGDERTAPATGAEAPEPEPAPSVEAPAVPTPELATLEASAGLPSAVSLGSMTLAAERCALSGPELRARDAFEAIRAIAWTGDARILLIDGDGVLRRYVDVGDEACVLLPDSTFGEAGALTLGATPQDRPRSLAVDGHGHVYASSPLAGTDRLTGDHVDYHCATTGRVTVSPNGTTGFGLFGTGPARRIAFTDAGCTMSEWVPVEVPSILESVSFLDDDHLLVGGQDGREGPHTARRYGLDGQPSGPVFGSEDASAPDHLCYTHAAFPCAAGMCVLDGNCRAILSVDAEGNAVARAELSQLTGLSAPWIVPPVHVEHGMTIFAAANPEVLSDGTRSFVGSIYRLHGL